KEGQAMADEIQRVQYFYTEVSDKPGEDLKVLNALRDEAVNLSAFVVFPKGRRAQLDFVPMDQPAFKTAAKKAKVRLIGPKTAFLVKGDERRCSRGHSNQAVWCRYQYNSASRDYSGSRAVRSDSLG